MKRIEVYTQTKTHACYGSLGENLLELNWRKKYMHCSPEGVIVISLGSDSSSRVHGADEAILEIMPPAAEIPKELSDLLKKNHFVKKKHF
jgi:hypothetical protein